jgi:two-component system LytT family response regulator
MHHVTHIVADGNYTTVWLDDGRSYLIDRSMNEWESILPKPRFQRLERSLLINIAHLQEVQNISRNASRLRFSGREGWIEIGRIARIRLKQLLDPR